MDEDEKRAKHREVERRFRLRQKQQAKNKLDTECIVACCSKCKKEVRVPIGFSNVICTGCYKEEIRKIKEGVKYA